MPFSSNNGGGGGPWGGGGGSGGGGGKGPWGGGGGGGGQQGPDLDDLLRKGRDQLRVVLGGKGGGRGTGGGGGGGEPSFGPYLKIVIPIALVAFWLYQSLYTVNPDEKAVVLRLGEYSETTDPGLHLAAWPIFYYVKLPVTRENIVDIGTGLASGSVRASEQGLMLTGDENIIDIGFTVVWNIASPEKFLFNLADPEATIQAVSESAMREIVGRSEMTPLLSSDREALQGEVKTLIQETLSSYDVGVNIVRVNLSQAAPPPPVEDAFLDVQAAEQDRVTEENKAEAYANQKLAGARGQAAQIQQEAEGYAAQVVNQAKGEAARFDSVYEAYKSSPEVTRRRLYIETLEKVMGDVNKTIVDDSLLGKNGSGILPYLPLDALKPKEDKQ